MTACDNGSLQACVFCHVLFCCVPFFIYPSPSRVSPRPFTHRHPPPPTQVLESSNHSLIGKVYKDLRADMEKAWRLLTHEMDLDDIHPGTPLLIATMLR